MGRVRNFLAWPLTEKWLFAKAVLLVCAVRVALWTLKYNRTKSAVARFATQPKRRVGRPRLPAARIGRLVELASRLVPGGGHCLTKAMAAAVLLQRRGYDVTVTLGVRKDDDEKVLAHAWIQQDETILIGDQPDLELYSVFESR